MSSHNKLFLAIQTVRVARSFAHLPHTLMTCDRFEFLEGLSPKCVYELYARTSIRQSLCNIRVSIHHCEMKMLPVIARTFALTLRRLLEHVHDVLECKFTRPTEIEQWWLALLILAIQRILDW